MKISARNQLKGKVVKFTVGAVNAEVIIEIEGGQQISSIITKTSAENMGIEVGKEVYAIVKASEVMVGIDE